METGIIYISATKRGFIPKAIRFFRKPFVNDVPEDEIASHAAIVLFEKYGEYFLGEATDPYLRIFPLSKYISKNKKIELWQVPNISDEIHIEAIKKLLTLTSSTYGYLQFLGYVWIWVGKKLGFKASNPVKIDREIVCSEYAYLYLKNIGFKDSELSIMNPNDIAPDNIRKAMRYGAELIAVSQYGEDTLNWL